MHGPETRGKKERNKQGTWIIIIISIPQRNLVLISRNASNMLKLHFFPGTSMSFGFKKKTFSTTSKKQLQNIANNNNVNVNREKDENSTIISNLNVINAEQNNLIITGDDNGNSTNTGD